MRVDAFNFDWNQFLEFGKTVKENFSNLQELFFQSSLWIPSVVGTALATFIGLAIAGALIKWST